MREVVVVVHLGQDRVAEGKVEEEVEDKPTDMVKDRERYLTEVKVGVEQVLVLGQVLDRQRIQQPLGSTMSPQRRNAHH